MELEPSIYLSTRQSFGRKKINFLEKCPIKNVMFLEVANTCFLNLNKLGRFTCLKLNFLFCSKNSFLNLSVVDTASISIDSIDRKY